MEKACIYHGRCGGCNLKSMSYNKEIEYKKKKIEKLFSFQKKEVNDPIRMDNPNNYRYKTIHTFKSFNKKTLFGIYQENSHQVVDLDSCLIENEIATKIYQSIKRIAISLKLLPYDEDKRLGVLRHVLIRVGYYTHEAMVVIVTGSLVFPGKNEFIKRLKEENKEIKTIVHNVNSRSTSVVLGDKMEVVFGKGYIKDKLCGLDFNISPKSFYQVNPFQTENLYNKAIEMADIKKTDRVLDTYSGIGTISLACARKAKEVVAVEIVPDAVRDSIKNAKENKITNVRFYLDDASRFMVNSAKKKETFDCVFMDPPRKGSDKAFLDSLILLKPKKIVYISCNPETQVNDLKYLLSKNKYEIKEIQPVDMFPRTEHVETVCCLSRKNFEK